MGLPENAGTPGSRPDEKTLPNISGPRFDMTLFPTALRYIHKDIANVAHIDAAGKGNFDREFRSVGSPGMSKTA
jgi:hypothetical protein